MKKQQLVVSFPSYKLGTFHNPLPDIGRNDPCPCKSGKKYKRCCGLKQAGMIAAKCVDVSKRNSGYTPTKATPDVFTYPATPNKPAPTPLLLAHDAPKEKRGKSIIPALLAYVMGKGGAK